jgi:hypothetical protein
MSLLAVERERSSSRREKEVQVEGCLRARYAAVSSGPEPIWRKEKRLEVIMGSISCTVLSPVWWGRLLEREERGEE